jgi:hypothetical protein
MNEQVAVPQTLWSTVGPFAEAREHLARVLAWPANQGEAYVNVHWTYMPKDGNVHKDARGKPLYPWTGRAATSVHEAINAVEFAVSRESTRDVYVCLSTQRECEERTSASGFKYKAPVRSQQNAVALKSFFIDLDAKGADKDSYTSPAEANAALDEFIKAVGLPSPSVVVNSGNGLHIYWVVSRPLTPEEWRPLAFALADATKRHGLKCDTQCTIDSARVLRIPNTLNRKTDPSKPVTIAGNPTDFDYPLERIEKALAPYKVAGTTSHSTPYYIENPSLFPQRTPVNDNELGAGIYILKPALVDLDNVASECAFIGQAIATGGMNYTNPLWNLTTLIATFTEGGRVDAHRMGDKHLGYTEESTDVLFDRKEREKAEKNLGWPSCQAISGSGCTACQSCRHFAAGKSPLHLVGRALPPQVTPSLGGLGQTRSLTAGLEVAFANVPHRQMLYGIDLYAGEVTVLAAPGGHGKTSLAIGIAVCLAANRARLGEKLWIYEPTVLYVNGEDSTPENLRRLWGFSLQHGIVEGDIKRLKLLAADDYRTQQLSFLRLERGASVLDDRGLEFLSRLLEAIRPQVLVLDPLISFCGGGNANDNAVMALVMRALKRFAAKFGCAILVLHHTRKGGEPGHPDSISGASSIVNLSRRAIMVVPMTKEEAAKFAVPPSEYRSYFKVVSAKSNMAPPSEECPWYKLESVNLPNAEPPTYPNGDNVQAVVRVKQDGLKRGDDLDDQKIKKTILDVVHGGKSIGGQIVPYSPSVSGAKNDRAIVEDAMAAVAAATAPRQWHEADLRAAAKRTIRRMEEEGWIVQEEIKKGRFRTGQGFKVAWTRTPWPNSNITAETEVGLPVAVDGGAPQGGDRSDGQLVNGVVNG